MKSWFASKRSSDSHLLFSGPRHSHPLGSNTNDRFNYPILPARLPKRYTRILLAVLVSLCVVHFIRSEKPWSSHRVHELELGNEIPLYPEAQDNPLDHNLPPLYEAYAEYEDFLSEQNIQNYTSQRYISFANHVHSCGWGNVMQDMVFNALLAAEANIGFVYDDYLWRNSDGSNYSEFNGKPIPARIPISTMLSGKHPSFIKSTRTISIHFSF
ncbi:hypothetical protein M413DRAFT_25183 [Hebeloma cylindrosporum]|uniref:Uncharacterized protein n=1 Tax=Hebeloma cylindrosporum TaxID=76867 RepID=A0A0C3C7C1_HEBCY|nr:hypothetical protein M413DRAFT_25183 [Hebeloma cylindrosporum h7]